MSHAVDDLTSARRLEIDVARQMLARFRRVRDVVDALYEALLARGMTADELVLVARAETLAQEGEAASLDLLRQVDRWAPGDAVGRTRKANRARR